MSVLTSVVVQIFAKDVRRSIEFYRLLGLAFPSREGPPCTLISSTRSEINSLISNITDVVTDEIEIWRNRPVDEVYPIVYSDGELHGGLQFGALGGSGG